VHGSQQRHLAGRSLRPSGKGRLRFCRPFDGSAVLESKGTKLPPERLDAEKIQRELYSKEAHGIRASAMEQFLREAGFSPYVFRGEWSDLASHVEQGRPLIASIQPGAKASLHYVVVVGIDRQQEAVLLNDPARGKLFRVERAEFEKEWLKTNNWTLLAVPKHTE